MLRFIKDWTLPLAMLTGTIIYLAFANFDFLTPLRPAAKTATAILTPTLIFAQLLITFSKIDTKDLKPSRWHLWLMLFQVGISLAIVALLAWGQVDIVFREIFEGALVCFICPTATAAAVITAKLGGNASSLTTYTLLSNFSTAIFVPLLFPIVEPHGGLTFFDAFLMILGKVFPLLLSPFIIALLIKAFMPRLHGLLVAHSNVAFYLWGIALVIVSGQTVKSLCESDAGGFIKLLIAAAGLITCCLQFWLGRRVGRVYGERITAGQALGQKNTVLAIWMAATYLDPVTSVAPGSYVLWQNSINSWQLWKQRKNQKDKQ